MHSSSSLESLPVDAFLGGPLLLALMLNNQNNNNGTNGANGANSGNDVLAPQFFDPYYHQHHASKMNTRELTIQAAIDDLRAGVFTSQRKAAAAYGVPRSTLQERINGRQPNAIAHSNQQRLTPEQEAFLVDWILDEDSRAQPPSHPRVREMATRILHMNGDYEPLGQLWVPHFINRNPRVASIVGRTIGSARSTAASYETIRAFLELFERTRVELGIHYEDIWNMDETGVALGVCTNAQVLASSSKKKAYIKSPEDHLAPFSVVKSRYREQIRALSALDDAAPIKKERFVVSYNKAREEGLSERIIRAGWRATGLCPYNPEQVLHSSQISGRPSTPPATNQEAATSGLVFNTPQSSQALYKAHQQLLQSENLSRSTRLVLGKAGKAIAAANTRAAQLQAENERLKYKLDSSIVTRSRKRVQINPNERFSNVETIKAAID
ncbi:hypothetical protein OPT61_g2826 [Boeremia exigua]|uniref:Uncharacterized protein n=1 Tax=Boeremia exigua TaxID=749465 RepID=A0ACC2IK40_9PLEO|nr:hypothetical protein OPT61_g2826 [Boeremia exigua]